MQRDPVAEQQKAEADATIVENRERANVRRRRNRSSLLTMGAQGDPQAGRSLLAQASGEG